MLTIPNYKILEKINEGNRFDIYRGIKLDEQCQPVIIKMLKAKLPITKHADRLKHEFELCQRITSQHVIKYKELILHDIYGYILIEEDDQATALINYIPKEGLDLLPFLQIALSLTEGLQDIHKSNVIHRDINPNNIIIHPETGMVKYIDFDRASLFGQYKQVTANSSISGKRLIYISPEQTGRTNELLDYRTDFYSLGVTFYQLLCGKLPFSEKKALELVHCHIAKQPPSPHQVKPSIPLPLSDIIMKLLNKNVANRYQSTIGLLADLKRCFNEWQEKKEISSFNLGNHDIVERFYISRKIYGRDSELTLLKEGFDRISQGKSEIIKVAGPAGVGKSTLVNALQPYIASKQGYFLAGKFEKLNRNVAYSAIKQAFQDWIKQLLVYSSEEEILLWKKQFMNALGNNGSLVVEAIPDLKFIIKEQPSVPSLYLTQTKNRFHLAFQDFISVIATAKHPVVLFLDDLQWADLASLNLLKALMSDPHTQYLLFIGAYRDNEVDFSHPLLATLQSIEKTTIPSQSINLSSLNLSSVNQWLAEITNVKSYLTSPLATLIYQKTAGNPFFIKVFLQAIYEERLLTWVENIGWQWDLEKIAQYPATDNVITLMTHRIHQTPQATQEILKFASCLGHQITLNTLGIITQKRIEQLLTYLQPAFENNLLLSSGRYFKFSHDRVRETAYELIAKEARAAMHLLIGRLLREHLPLEPSAEQLFEMVDHLNRGKALVTDNFERFELAKFNFKASKKAKLAIAYTSALNYLQVAESYLTLMDIWQEDYPFAFELYKELAEIAYLNGQFEQMTKYSEILLARAYSKVEKVDIYTLLIVQKTLTSQYQEAIDIGYQALKLFGIDFQASELSPILYQELAQLKENLGNKNLTLLLNLPNMEDIEKKTILKLLHELLMSTYFFNPPLCALITVIMINLTLKYGNAPESGTAYAYYGWYLCANSQDYQLGYEFGDLAIQFSKKFNNEVQKCKSYTMMVSFIYCWSKPLRTVIPWIDEGYQAGITSGELQYAGYLCPQKARTLFEQGVPLTVVSQEITPLMNFCQKTHNQIAIDAVLSVQLIIESLVGKTQNKMNFLPNRIDDEFFQHQCAKNQAALVIHHILKAKVLYLYENFNQALQEIQTTKPLLKFIPGFYEIALHNWYYSLTLTALYPNVNVELKKQYEKQLEANQSQLEIWAKHCPENFLHKYKVVAAEICRIKVDILTALDLYEEAIALSGDTHFIPESALINELAGKFWLSQNKPSCAQGPLLIAYQLYEQWGAKLKVNSLMHQHKKLLSPFVSSYPSNFTAIDNPISIQNLQLFDLASIMQTSQMISSDIDLPKLLYDIMKVLIENAGAQKGAFFLETTGNLLLQAEYKVDGQLSTLQQLPLANWENGAHSIINYVARTQTPLLLNNANHDKQFNCDPYISHHNIQSVLCMPIIKQGKIKGILYLENNLAPNIFTEQHIQILTILTSQITISLENATLYESMKSVTERLNLALKAGKVGTWNWMVKDNKVNWDTGVYELHGIKKETFMHTLEDYIGLVHPDDRASLQQAIKCTLEEQAPYNIEYRIIRADDKSIRFIRSQGKAYYDNQGKIEYIVGISWDVTQRKHLEAERLQALTQAEEKERRRAEEAEKYRRNLEDFINMICHEIRNPLAAVYSNVDFLAQTNLSLKSYLDILPMDVRSTFNELLHKLEENTKEIEHCVSHQKSIIDDVLNLSKTESGKADFVVEPFRLKSIIEDVVKIFAASLKSKKISLILLLPESDPWIKSDASRLKMVLINLVANSLKFTEQGYIKIKLNMLEVTPTYTTFTLSVEDTGSGMTPEEQSQLFQRFARITTTEYGGSGLGLFISKRFIEQLGGLIEVKSQKGQGTEFTIQLTCESAEAKKKPVSSMTPPLAALSNLSLRKHLLIVEDNVINQRILCRQLEQAGHICEVANNGEEALNKWANASFDLILMDIEMPVMGGFEATQAIRRKEEDSGQKVKIPIIGLSAYTSNEFMQKAYAIGMNDYITKPYDKEKLYNTINQWTTLPSEHADANILKSEVVKQTEENSTLQKETANVKIENPPLIFSKASNSNHLDTIATTYLESKRNESNREASLKRSLEEQEEDIEFKKKLKNIEM